MHKYAKQRQKLKNFIEQLKTDPKKLNNFIKKLTKRRINHEKIIKNLRYF